jgi:predicted nucleotide-binding protein
VANRSANNGGEERKRRPRVFIGSSSEGLDVARAIQAAIYYDAEPVIWSQGVFGLSGGTLEALVHAGDKFDFAVFVLTPDDLVVKRRARGNAPRDNVLFELGLFMGQIGRERTFFVHCQTDNILLPSDLAGVTAATYLPPSEPQFLHAAVSGACTPILAAIRTLGSRRIEQVKGAGGRTEIDELRSQVAQMRVLLGSLSAVARETPVYKPSGGRPRKPGGRTDCSFLLGTWKGKPSGSTAWCFLVRGKPRFLYSYLGHGEPTGEYYDWRRIGETVVGKFRWFDVSEMRGYAWFAVHNPSELRGGWWMHDEVPSGHERKLPHVPNMVPLNWVKKSATVPKDRLSRLQKMVK